MKNNPIPAPGTGVIGNMRFSTYHEITSAKIQRQPNNLHTQKATARDLHNRIIAIDAKFQASTVFYQGLWNSQAANQPGWNICRCSKQQGNGQQLYRASSLWNEMAGQTPPFNPVFNPNWGAQGVNYVTIEYGSGIYPRLVAIDLYIDNVEAFVVIDTGAGILSPTFHVWGGGYTRFYDGSIPPGSGIADSLGGSYRCWNIVYPDGSIGPSQLAPIILNR